MNLDDPNFFKLNYLCLNKKGLMVNQSAIIEKNIKNPRKMQRVISGTSPISKNNTQKYFKIENLKIKQNLKRPLTNNRKTYNKINQTYCSENYTKANAVLRYPISIFPSNDRIKENKSSCNFNLYNEMINKANNNNINNKRYNLTESYSNYSNENISSGNIINNNFIPLSETKYNYLKDNNTYYYTNLVFKLDNGLNFKNVFMKSIIQKKSPVKKIDANFKKISDINQKQSGSDFDINKSYNLHHIHNLIIDKNYYKEEKNINNKSISFKLSSKSKNNNAPLLNASSFKSDFSKMMKNKNGIKTIIHSLKRQNNSNNTKKINNYKKNKNLEIKLNNKSQKINLSNEKENCFIRKESLNTNDNNDNIFKNNSSKIIVEDQNENYQKTNSRECTNNIDEIKTDNSKLELKLEENKNSNNEFKNINNMLELQINKYEQNIKVYQRDITNLKNEIIKLTNENDKLKKAMKNYGNIKISKTISNRNSPPSIQNKKNGHHTRKELEENLYVLNNKFEKIKRQNDLHLKQIAEKNKKINEKEEIIKNLTKQLEEKKTQIDILEKNLKEMKLENDNLYKYKSLYDDKEIELIQYKNNMNKYKIENNRYDSLKLEYDELLNNFNEIRDYKDKYLSLIKELENYKNIENKYNDLMQKFNNIKEENEEMKEIKNKFNELLKQNNKLIDTNDKYNKMKQEYEELKEIREKYGKILKEQKHLLLIENKYNDLIEEVKELREIKKEYKRLMDSEESKENSNIFKYQNISFGNENGFL